MGKRGLSYKRLALVEQRRVYRLQPLATLLASVGAVRVCDGGAHAQRQLERRRRPLRVGGRAARATSSAATHRGQGRAVEDLCELVPSDGGGRVEVDRGADRAARLGETPRVVERARAQPQQAHARGERTAAVGALREGARGLVEELEGGGVLALDGEELREVHRRARVLGGRLAHLKKKKNSFLTCRGNGGRHMGKRGLS